MTFQPKAVSRPAPFGARSTVTTQTAPRSFSVILDDALQEALVLVWQHIHRDRGAYLRRSVGLSLPTGHAGARHAVQPSAPDPARMAQILSQVDQQDRTLAEAVLGGERNPETLIRQSGLRAEAVLARLTALRRKLRDSDARASHAMPIHLAAQSRGRRLTT